MSYFCGLGCGEGLTNQGQHGDFGGGDGTVQYGTVDGYATLCTCKNL